MSELTKRLKGLDKFKYPLLILVLGLLLMLLPTGGAQKQATEEQSADGILSAVLTATEGVGRAKVIVSDSGVVVVCQGAGNADVRLDIIKAVSAYTGFGSDKITVLKMADADLKEEKEKHEKTEKKHYYGGGAAVCVRGGGAQLVLQQPLGDPGLGDGLGGG